MIAAFNSPARPSLIAFSVKANGNLAVLKTLGDLGAGADVVSGGEMRRALAAGIPADKIVFATDTPLGPIKPTIEVIDRLGLSDADRRKVFCGNAEKLLKMQLG